MAVVRTPSGRRICYDAVGSGAPLVLIPGQGGDRRGCLAWLASALARDFRVVSLDNRDAGESDPEADYYALADLAADVAALLDELDIARAHVLGHSLGGRIALRFALDRPDRLDRLVLVSSASDGEPWHRAGDPPPPPADWWIDDPVERMRALLPRVLGPDYRARMGPAEEAALVEPERDNRTTWAGLLRQEAAKADHVADRLAEVQAPTLVVVGEADGGLTAFGRELAAGIPRARLLALPGVGHLPWVEQPDVVVPAIAAFLASTVA